MKALLCEWLIACVLAAPGARTADELAYGNLLFAYFQDDFTGALVESMVAEQRGTLGDDPTRFVLARGSLAFAEGLHRMSDNAFASLDPAALQDIDRMRLSFHRARAYYRDGDWPAMSTALDDIRFEPGWFGREREHPEVAFMRAEAALVARDFGAAERHLGTLRSDEDYLGYGLYNLAVAQREAGDPRAAHAAFERLADLPLDGRPGQDLVQRGRLAYAVTTGEVADPVDAQQVLERLPSAGRYRDSALAAYGTLAMNRADYALAARIWLTLQEGEDWHEGRAVAELGLPTALEALDVSDQALAAWYRAADRFEARLVTLETLRSTTTTGWIGELLEAHRVDRPDGDTLVPEGIADTFGTQTWLAWLAREDVNRLIGEWRDLARMQDWLDTLPEQLAALEEVKQERRRRSELARARLADQALDGRRSELVARIDAIGTTLAELSDPTGPLDTAMVNALATPQEQALLARIEALGRELADGASPAERDPLADRIARLRGVVLWTIAEARSARLQALARDQATTRQLLAGIEARIDRMERAEADLAAGVETDFRLLTARADGLANSVAVQLDERATAIATAFEDAVETEMQRIHQYLLAARVAIARTTDQLAAAGVPQPPES